MSGKVRTLFPSAGVAMFVSVAFIATATAAELSKLDRRLVAELDARRSVGDVEREVRVIVDFDQAPDPNQIEAVTSRSRSPYYVSRWNNFVQVAVPFDDVARLAEVPGIRAVEYDYPVYSVLDTAVAAIKIRESNDYSPSTVHEFGYRGEGMVIAVIDTGVDGLHESLDDLDDDASTTDPKTITGADASTPITIGCIDVTDDQLHGTHVAGIAAGTGGPSGLHRGVAPAARIIEINIDFGGASIGGIVRALEWIFDYNAGISCYGDPGEDTVDVVNISFGSSGDGGNGTDTSSQTVDTATMLGITVCVSAGNCGPGGDCGADNGDEFTVGSPAVASGAISCASSEDRGTIGRVDDSISAFSSRGPRRSDGDGNPLDELNPTITAPGGSIFSAFANTGNQYIGFSGTSMASPMTAGLAALLLEINPGLAPTGPDDVPVRDLLIRTAETRTGGQNPAHDRVGAFGRPWNNAWGHGLLDGAAAATLAIETQLIVDELSLEFVDGGEAGPQIRLRLRAVDGSGHPVAGARISLDAVLPDGREKNKSPLTNANGEIVATRRAPLAGTYTVDVSNGVAAGLYFNPAAGTLSTQADIP